MESPPPPSVSSVAFIVVAQLGPNSTFRFPVWILGSTITLFATHGPELREYTTYSSDFQWRIFGLPGSGPRRNCCLRRSVRRLVGSRPRAVRRHLVSCSAPLERRFLYLQACFFSGTDVTMANTYGTCAAPVSQSSSAAPSSTFVAPSSSQAASQRSTNAVANPKGSASATQSASATASGFVRLAGGASAAGSASQQAQASPFSTMPSLFAVANLFVSTGLAVRQRKRSGVPGRERKRWSFPGRERIWCRRPIWRCRRQPQGIRRRFVVRCRQPQGVAGPGSFLYFRPAGARTFEQCRCRAVVVRRTCPRPG